MKLPVNDFKNLWYIAQGFGEKTDYGYHEGVDLNLKTGGDTDLGQSLMAIANGQVTSVHEHTGIPTFGKHLHIKFDSPFGVRFVHYAHCQKILVPEGASVTEGQQVAELGKSGTKVAHCHFAIKNQPTGVDGIAKTQEDLAKWEDPIVFIEKCIQEEEKAKEVVSVESLNQQIIELHKQMSDAHSALASLQDTISKLQAEIKGYEEDAGQLREENRNLVLADEKQRIRIKELEDSYQESEKQLQATLEALAGSKKLTINDFSTFYLAQTIIKRFFGKGGEER